ncbi:cytochrome c oxidase assembly protein [Poseidonocella sp. HB161398]|uniref:cytochrome c oxidase assembly protein n=1 Tax=Poseidonocella sp. HB161398 TaxID=2320855 RepID=UPI001109A555|nr:cytochrome c oxidase assembly protein [Poseidonocella sp. HB161398]
MKLDGTRKTLAATIGTVLFMGAMAWAAVPFYSWFCQVTGFGGTTGVAAGGAHDVLEREITIRFDGSKDRNMPWEFRPLQREMKLKIGETGIAFYEATNPTGRTIAGSATYNVTPYEAGGFFTKIDCFCFTLQVLEPGETVQMPVTFYVDPEIVDDRDAKFVHTITLSYTFYETDLPEDHAEVAPGIATETPKGG